MFDMFPRARAGGRTDPVAVAVPEDEVEFEPLLLGAVTVCGEPRIRPGKPTKPIPARIPSETNSPTLALAPSLTRLASLPRMILAAGSA